MQGAGHSWQQEVSPLAPLGVSATQESDSGVPQSESEYKGLDELLGKAKRDRVGHRNGGRSCRTWSGKWSGTENAGSKRRAKKKKVVSKTPFSAETHSGVTSPKPSESNIPISASNVNKEPPTTAAGRLATSDIQGNSSLGSIAALVADVKGSPLPAAMDT